MIHQSLSKGVFSVNPYVLQFGEVLEMKRSMLITIEWKWSVDLHVYWLFLDPAKCTSHEAIIPCVVLRYQEVASDLVAEQ